MDNKTTQGMSVRDQMIDYAERNTVIDLSGRRVYIAGPMTGIAELNRPAFFAAEEYLRGQGAIVNSLLYGFHQLEIEGAIEGG